MGGKLSNAGITQGPDALAKKVGSAAEGQFSDEIRRGEWFLFGPQFHQMPAMHLQVAGIGRFILGLEFCVSVE